VRDALPGSYGNRGINLPGFALEAIRGCGLGFYGYLYRHMFGNDDELLTIGRLELLRQELPRLLEAVGQPVTDEMREFIYNAAPRNVARHAHYTQFYEEELRDLVAERDAPIIARHAYGFGD
jgi:hypothetical protein